MSHRAALNNLKDLNINNYQVSLAILKEYKVNRISQYRIKYVPIDENLEVRLRDIVTRKINNSNTVVEYTYDSPEPEEDQVSSIDSNQTDFYRIFEQLVDLNPEEDIIEDVEELVQGAKAYLIILRGGDGIEVVGFKTIPENWKMKKNKGLIPLLYHDNRFVDLEDENVFSIANSLDLIYYDETLFVLSKKDFEQGLNFRDGMIAHADEMYAEAVQLNVFVNIEILTSRVGNNQRYLRKIATIRNLGHYRNPSFLERLREVSLEKNWDIVFQNGQIVLTEATLDTVLSLLQNKRLHSEITLEDFDVDGRIDPVN